MTTNEAAERLRDGIRHADRAADLSESDLDLALAAERRATVERIRADITAAIEEIVAPVRPRSVRGEKAAIVAGLRKARAILDEEAA